MAKPYSTLDLVNFEKSYKYASLVRKIQDIFQGLDLADLAGFVIKSFAEQNLTDDGNGNVTITVNMLEGEVAIGTSPNSVYLRNNAGILQYSNDHTTWHDVGSGGGGGSGDMLKSVYDIDEDNIIDRARKLTTNGTQFFEYGDIQNIKTKTDKIGDDIYFRHESGGLEYSHDGVDWLPTRYVCGEQRIVFNTSALNGPWLPCGIGGGLVTIGDSQSNATCLADDVCHDLFVLLWAVAGPQFLNLYDSTGQQISFGQSADADWAAHDQLSLPNLNGSAMDIVTFIHL